VCARRGRAAGTLARELAEPLDGLRCAAAAQSRLDDRVDHGHGLVQARDLAEHRRLVQHGGTNGVRVVDRHRQRDDRTTGVAEHTGGREAEGIEQSGRVIGVLGDGGGHGAGRDRAAGVATAVVAHGGEFPLAGPERAGVVPDRLLHACGQAEAACGPRCDLAAGSLQHGADPATADEGRRARPELGVQRQALQHTG